MPRRGQRPPRTGSRRQPRQLLHFLCDEHIGKAIREAISAVPGYAASRADLYGVAKGSGDGFYIDRASAHRMVVLTSDIDTILPDHPRRVCTHEGILKLYHGRGDLEDFIPHLVRFLKTAHYKLCKHGYVELYEDEIVAYRLFGRGEPRRKSFSY
jgi:hypothetical protein